MPIKIDPNVKLPGPKTSEIDPFDRKAIDPNTPLIYGPGSGRIISSSAAHRFKDLSYRTWNPELGEYEDVSKFTNYGVFFSNYGTSWQEQRARGQTTGEKWNHGLKKAAITTGGAIVENTLGIIAGVGELLQGGQYHNNEVGKMVDGWNDWARKEMPNYYTEEERNMGLMDRVGTANFWADKVANGFGYTLGSLATMYATGGYGLIGLSAKGLQLVGTADKVAKANKIYKLYKTAQGTKRGEKLLAMYDKMNRGARIKNGLFTLEAGAMMSLAESSVEARETQRHVKEQLLAEAEEKYPDGIPQSVLKEIEDLSQASGNSSFIGNMAVLSLSNIAMFNKFLAGNVTKQSLKGGITGGGLTKTGKTIVDKGSNSLFGRVRKWTKPLRRGALIEGLQEGGQYAINIASTEYHTSRFDNKGGITMMQALSEGVSRTFGETEGLESMLIGSIVGGISGGATGVGQTKQRNKLAKKVQSIMNDDAFMNVIDRSQSNTVTSHYLDKADKYRAEGKDKLADQAMTQAFINHIATLDNAGGLEFFTERLEDFKSLSDTEFKELFGIPVDQAVDKNAVIDNMIEETNNIVRRKDALDLLFPEDETRGIPRRLLGTKGREEEKQRLEETRILKAQMLHNAVFLDQISNEKKEIAKEVDSLYPGITLSSLEEQADLATEQFDALVEQYIRNAQATNQVDENGNPITNINQIPQEDLLKIHNQAYTQFLTGVQQSVSNVNLTHPLDKEALGGHLQEYYLNHRKLQDLMETWNKLQTNEGQNAYIRAALIDGQQSIRDANDRRANEILDNEADPNAAMDNIPPGASKAKRTEIENEVKRMKKAELALMNKYGDPEMSVEEIDRAITAARHQINDLKDANDPKTIKMLNFKIKVLETIKGLKLDAETTIKEAENKKGVEEVVEEEAPVEQTGRGRKQIDRIKKDYENAKQPQEKLGLIQRFINNVYQGAEATQEEIDFFNNEIEVLKKEGFEIQMETQPGNIWSEGMNVEVIWRSDDTLPEGVKIIDRVDEPGIMKDGKLHRRAKVVVKIGRKEGTERPALVEEANKAQDMPGTGKKKLDAIKKARKALSEFDNQFINPFNLADLASEESIVSAETGVTPIDQKEYEIHLEGNWGPGGWAVYKEMSVPGIKLGDQRGKSPNQVSLSEEETDTKKIFILTDRGVTDHTGRRGSTSVAMVFDKNSPRTLQEVQENLLNLNAELQATRSTSSFDAAARKQIEQLDMKEIATPTRNTEIVEEAETTNEEAVVKEELSAIEEDRLKNELETEQHKDLTSEVSEVAQIPIGEMENYYQELLNEEEELRNRLEKEDDDC